MKALLCLICIISTVYNAEAITLYKHYPRDRCRDDSVATADNVTIHLIVRLHGAVPDGNYTAKTNGNYGTAFFVGWNITVSDGAVANPPEPLHAFDVLNFASGGPVDWDCDAQLAPPYFTERSL